MRGIAFIGGEGPPPQICRRLAAEQAPGSKDKGDGLDAPLIRDALIIAAADSGLIAAENAGIRPDWIIGDMDSLDDPSRLDKYPAERVLRYPADKDYTDTELVFSLLREKGCTGIWLVGGGGGRTDHLFAIRSLFEREDFPRRWITAREDIYVLEAPESVAAALTVNPSCPVSVFPLGKGPWKALSRGLKWPLDNIVWDRGFFGLSNIAVDGSFSISAEQGRFMVITPLEEGVNDVSNYY